jgi:hypothetical protein
VLDYIELSEEYGIIEVPVPKSWENKSLKELNVRMSNIEQNFTTTPQQLKELIMLLHHQEIGQTQPTE